MMEKPAFTEDGSMFEVMIESYLASLLNCIRKLEHGWMIARTELDAVISFD